MRDSTAWFTPLCLLNCWHVLPHIEPWRSRNFRDFMCRLLLLSIGRAVQSHPLPVFWGVLNPEHWNFHFISSYPRLQNIRFCHWRSRDAKKSKKEYLPGVLLQTCSLANFASWVWYRVNQGYRWHFFEVNSFSSKTILIKHSSPSNFGPPSGWPAGKDGSNTKCRSALRVVERLRTMIGIQ